MARKRLVRSAKKSSQTLSYFIYILGALFLPIVFILGMQFEGARVQKRYQAQLGAESSPEDPQNSDTKMCKWYSESVPQEEFVRIYKVKAGDTLLSIARQELGSTSRIYEIVRLNRLNEIRSPIEIGMKLYLTPKEFPINTGFIAGAYGKVIKIDEKGFWKISTKYPQGPLDYVTVAPEFSYNYDKEAVKEGECVRIIYDNMSMANAERIVYKAIRIDRQENLLNFK